MRVQLLSDTHLEFHVDNGESFINSLDSTDVDVLILAGDICTRPMLINSLRMFSDKYKSSTILYVFGNHELYHASFQEVRSTLKRVDRDNVKVLDNTKFELDGIKFLGTTLWFRNRPDNFLYAHYMNDFGVIKHFGAQVYEENEKALAFLHSEMDSNSVVITHHLPSEKCVHERFKGSALNRFFVCDIEQFIINRQPKMCVWGHTHESFDFNIGPTKMLCNPFGYVGTELNTAFKDKLIVEL